MTSPSARKLVSITSLDELLGYLRDELGWPIESEDFDDVFFSYDPAELGIDPANAAKFSEIKQLRPLVSGQPFGVFFVKFEPKKLPVVALRRILSQLALKKRSSLDAAERVAWSIDNILFISACGERDNRETAFAHFSAADGATHLPTLKVLGWDNLDTPLHLDHVAGVLHRSLAWPTDEGDLDGWRRRWCSAFTLGNREVITTSRVLAIRLAELARSIRDRIRSALAVETSAGPVTRLMAAFKEALIHDLDEDSFADMYAQTIAYGLLSSRVAHSAKSAADDPSSVKTATTPFLRELMEAFLTPSSRKSGGVDFDELGVGDIVDLLDASNMEAVLRDFGNRNPQEDPVIHFYELFLREYDARKRLMRGVFYTPRPVVSYIVRSVDESLRVRFGLEDGLADTSTWAEVAHRLPGLDIPEGVDSEQAFVQILDPATGTGTFLVEVIDLVHERMRDKWKALGHREAGLVELWNEYVPRHLLPRLHGYELLMAPYAIAHLKIGLKLHETGYEFGSDERAQVFLTNALEPASDAGQQVLEGMLPALAHEARAVNEVKRARRFTVVVGNPPYSGVSSNMDEHAQRMVDAYKVVDGQPLAERKVWLQDDYVKFIRLAETTVVEAGAGVLGYITNHTYTDNPTFRGMRQSLMTSFSGLDVLDLHGNTTRRESPPEGLEDKNVFDIQQGVAICLGVRQGSERSVRHADLWGPRTSKYAWLLSHSASTTQFEPVMPNSPYYFFAPRDETFRDEYEAYTPLPEACPVNVSGIVTSRDAFVIDRDPDALLSRMRDYADPSLSDEAAQAKYSLSENYAWRIHESRSRLMKDGVHGAKVLPIAYRPFDTRCTYYDSAVVWRTRGEVMRHVLAPDNFALVVCRQSGTDGWRNVFVARGLVESCYVSNRTREIGYVVPVHLISEATTLFGESEGPRANLSPSFIRDLTCGLACGDDTPGSEDIFRYIYAVLHSPGYRSRYSEFLKIDFPRIPIPRRAALFSALAEHGRRLVGLHLLDSVERSDHLATYTGPRNPVVERIDWAQDGVWLDASRPARGESAGTGTTGFRGVTEDVWRFQVGAYQVCEKWLKDRKGRTLSDEDIAHYGKMVAAISETIRTMQQIDDVIEEHGGWPDAFASA